MSNKYRSTCSFTEMPHIFNFNSGLNYKPSSPPTRAALRNRLEDPQEELREHTWISHQGLRTKESCYLLNICKMPHVSHCVQSSSQISSVWRVKESHLLAR